MSKARTPAIEGWFKDGPDPALIGTQCTSCQSIFFPPERTFCRNPACMNDEFSDKELSRRGKLWSYTTNNYQPPAPVITEEPYQPYAMGMVDLDGGLRVMGRIDVDDPMAVEVGAKVELVVGKLGCDDEGNEIVTWMFRPV